MTQSQAYLELLSSQLPALQLLIQMGWTYLPPTEALHLRGGRTKNVVLTGILDPWLRANNHIAYKGEKHPFSDNNISQAIAKLVDEPFQSLIPTNQTLSELLTLGTSLTQTIRGDRKSYSLDYIDWQHPERNVYHVTDEFSVEMAGSHSTRRPDIVLFVNGIPLVVIECKRADKEHHGEKAIALGIEQLLTYQSEGEIPHLFATSQLLLSISPNDALYATTATPKKFWSLWRETGADSARLEAAVHERAVHERINRPLSAGDENRLYDWREYAGSIRSHFAKLGERLPTEQDRTLYALLRPERLLELAYQFIVFDDGKKKIARYQQYFAIQETLKRVVHRNAQGTRTGGVIWHTTGSGKSLTMVMLAKALALHPNVPNPRVVLVTDRVDLDDQIFGTFKACGKSVAQATSGKHLVRLVTGQLGKGERATDVITTLINKFEEAARQKVKAEGINTFVLVDESHRSQYGSMHAKMQRVFPNACYIGFTGTPLTKKEKSTAETFGSFIHKYPMRQAVSDKAVVPLLYEGRIVEQDVDKAQLERWFERTTRHLTDDQKADLKRKMSRSEAINATAQRIKEIAYNVALHYEQNQRGTGFKAQLATPSKAIATRYLNYLREYGIDAALAISPPDSREGQDEVDGDLPEVQRFWKRMMDRYGSEEAYNRELLSSFSQADGIEILVVVDKLLTGFDEPRNRVLYVDKPLREHTLLQAIARVNRLFEGKDFGYIIDYRGVLGELNQAINLYDALADFDAEDVVGTLADVSEQIERLPQLHSDLWAIFASVVNQRDREQMERHLEAEDRRARFYEALTDYARVLAIALASVQFYSDTPENRIQRYKDDLKYFHSLRSSVQLRYAETVDYRGDYEEKVRKLMDEHIKATGTTVITPLVNVFDAEKFDAEVEKLASPTAKADTILHRMQRSVSEHMDEDPAYYRKFSELIAETIRAYREGRISELEYLAQAESQMDNLRQRRDNSQPGDLSRYRHAPAYYGALKEQLNGYGAAVDESQLAQAAIRQEEIIEGYKVMDWAGNADVKNQIRRALDDHFYEMERSLDLTLSSEELDALIEQVLEIAIARDRLSL
jgi:type I restriction enzyme R subunit